MIALIVDNTAGAFKQTGQDGSNNKESGRGKAGLNGLKLGEGDIEST